MQTTIISHRDCLLHEMGSSHPECPQRVEVIDEALRTSEFADKLDWQEALLVEKKHLLLVHDKNYVENIYSNSPKTGRLVLDPDTAMNPYTLKAAQRAAGALVQATDLVMTGKTKRVFCNVRPPGHHAEHNRAMGFCIFNNIAIGVKYALEHYGVKKITIVDFDVHHGNGTQDIFQHEDRVEYLSSYQYPFYPFSAVTQHSSHILHIPLPVGATGQIFRRLAEGIWFPAIAAFQPELIFISAGFDAHQADPLAELNFSEADYAWITEKVVNFADQFSEGRVISTLEGGYALEVLGACARAHVGAMV
ncbi:MAG TPA: histone deacetylase family protein [Gammaproteobacteria bacterium]|nr:histone deacetylase family protein [Gammaproteobacteria bacterium]